MHKRFLTAALAIAAAAGLTATAAHADTLYDTDVASWNVGSGQSNGHFQVVNDNGIQTGLRAQIRFAGAIDDADHDGVYLAPAGHSDAAGSGNALWNFDFSVDTGSVDNTTVTFFMDIDPTAGTNFYSWQSAGSVPAGSLVQDSQNFGFYQILYMIYGGNSFNPDADGLYNVRLDVTDASGAVLNRNEIQVQVGSGAPAAAVPLPSAAAAGLGLLPLLAFRRRRTCC
jgi:hypothetical protein